MIQRATFVGELAARILSLGHPGVVTRTFERSVYARAGSDYFLLLWGDTRSPMTVNVKGESIGSEEAKVGGNCELNRSSIQMGRLRIELDGARTYRASLLQRGTIALPDPRSLAKGVAMLRLMYDASPHGPTLPADLAFRSFARDTLPTYATPGAEAPGFEPFMPLVGRGVGFTPAGDDFCGGFTATFNYVARSGGKEPIQVPKARVLSKTVPESGAILVNSSLGYVDEGLQRLIIDSLKGRPFLHDLESLAARGHTSGMDMSLGALLAEACALDRSGGRHALESCLGALLTG